MNLFVGVLATRETKLKWKISAYAIDYLSSRLLARASELLHCTNFYNISWIERILYEQTRMPKGIFSKLVWNPITQTYSEIFASTFSFQTKHCLIIGIVMVSTATAIGLIYYFFLCNCFLTGAHTRNEYKEYVNHCLVKYPDILKYLTILKQTFNSINCLQIGIKPTMSLL